MSDPKPSNQILRYLAAAAGIRRAALRIKDNESRELLLQIADKYEALADRARNEGVTPPR